MVYATPDDYTTYVGAHEDEEELKRWLDQSMDIVDRATFNRIRAKGFDNLSEYQKEMVTKATCLQAKFMMDYGAYIYAPISGFSAGSISMSFSKDNHINGQTMDQQAINCLKNTGLTTRRL